MGGRISELTAKTPLTYYGGKQRLAQRIVSMFPEHRNYVEPYAGGLAVLFAKPRSEREIVNDLDGDVVNFWHVVREDADALAAALELTPYARDEWVGSADPAEDPVERARRFVTRISQSFARGGMYWSPPSLGGKRGGQWQPTTLLKLPGRVREAAVRLAGVAIDNRDACRVIKAGDHSDTVIYCDPPYAGPHRVRPGHGYREDSADTWPEMVDALLAIERAHVLVSGFPCAASERLEAAGWTPHALVGYDNAAGSRNTPTRREVPEMVWANFPIKGGTDGS